MRGTDVTGGRVVMFKLDRDLLLDVIAFGAVACFWMGALLAIVDVCLMATGAN